MYRNFRRASIIAIALAVLIFGIAFAAILDQVTLLDDYVVSYLGFENTSHTNVTKWTYAVTEPPSPPTGGGLSHWTLGVCTSFKLKDPQFNIVDAYETTTVTDIPECTDGVTFNCAEADYQVSFGNDGSTGVYGVKFEPKTPDDQLVGQTPQRTHVFQFLIFHPDGFQESPGDVVVKTGNGGLVGAIKGPQCPPTAVSLASFGASNGQSSLHYGLILILAAGLLLLVGGGSYIIARRMA